MGCHLEFNEYYQRQVSDVMGLLYRRGLVQVRGGNASIIDRENKVIYISPSGVPRHLISSDDIAIVNMEGKAIVGSPSSEWRMHVAIYKEVEGINAVVHAHPPHLLALQKVERKPEVSSLAETRLRVKCVAEVPALEPGTQELADAVSSSLKGGCNAALLKEHGAVAVSAGSIYEALEVIEALEDLARIELLTSI